MNNLYWPVNKCIIYNNVVCYNYCVDVKKHAMQGQGHRKIATTSAPL